MKNHVIIVGTNKKGEPTTMEMVGNTLIKQEVWEDEDTAVRVANGWCAGYGASKVINYFNKEAK